MCAHPNDRRDGSEKGKPKRGVAELARRGSKQSWDARRRSLSGGKREFPTPWQLAATANNNNNNNFRLSQSLGFSPPTFPPASSSPRVEQCQRTPPQGAHQPSTSFSVPSTSQSNLFRRDRLVDSLPNLVHSIEWDRGCSPPHSPSRPWRHPEPVGGAVHITGTQGGWTPDLDPLYSIHPSVFP